MILDGDGHMKPTNKPSVPGHGSRRSVRADLTLALLPTATVLIVFAVVDAWSHQKLLFASLAASAFLIYLDPEHVTNSARTLALSQTAAALVGFAAHTVLGPTYGAAALAMVVVILGMILARVVHPPAVPTALSFALGASSVRGLLLFGACVALLVGLVFLQRLTVRLVERLEAGTREDEMRKGTR